VGPKYFGTL